MEPRVSVFHAGFATMLAGPILTSKVWSSSINDWLLISTGSHRFEFPGVTPSRFLYFRSQYHNCLGLTSSWAAHHSLTLCPLILYSAVRVSYSACRSALVIRKTLLSLFSEKDYPLNLGAMPRWVIFDAYLSPSS
jgi:hypothetical protein